MAAPHGNNGPTPEYKAKPSIDGTTVGHGNGKQPSQSSNDDDAYMNVTEDGPRSQRLKQPAPTGVMVSLQYTGAKRQRAARQLFTCSFDRSG